MSLSQVQVEKLIEGWYARAVKTFRETSPTKVKLDKMIKESKEYNERQSENT